MKTKHTKGNWVISKSKNYVVNDVSDDPFRNFTVAKCDNTGIPLEEAEANAKLIAASPNLLQNAQDNHDVMLAIHTCLSSSNFNKEQASTLLRDAMVKTLSTINKATE